MPETGSKTVPTEGEDPNWFLGDTGAQGGDEAYGDDGFEDDGDSPAPTGPSGGTVPQPAPVGVSQDLQNTISQGVPASPYNAAKEKSLQPSNQYEWQDNTHQKLNMAKALVRDCQFQTSKNDLVTKNCSRRHEKVGGNLDLQIRSKLLTNSDLSKSIEERINSMEDTIRHLGSCLFGLQRAYRSKWSQLNVCERRMELRDGRPIQELVRDNLQASLENERQVLIEARQELNDHIVMTKDMLTQCEAMKQELIEDLQHKRHSQRIDRSCLHPEKPVRKDADRIFLPALPEITHYTLPPAPKDTAPGTGPQNEQTRCQTTMDAISRAIRLEEGVVGIIAENDAAIRHCNTECKAANAAVCHCMDGSNHQTEHLKQQLMEQMKQVDATIAEAERSMTRTKKKLESHNQPLRCLNKQFALRDRRTDREHIRDQVTDNMETHLEAVKKSVKELSGKWQGTKNILDHLKAAKAQMAEDLRYKNIALKIDDACRKVTPKKAIEHDALDPCSGRCHPDGKKSAAGRLQAVVDREFG